MPARILMTWCVGLMMPGRRRFDPPRSWANWGRFYGWRLEFLLPRFSLPIPSLAKAARGIVSTTEVYFRGQYREARDGDAPVLHSAFNDSCPMVVQDVGLGFRLWHDSYIQNEPS